MDSSEKTIRTGKAAPEDSGNTDAGAAQASVESTTSTSREKGHGKRSRRARRQDTKNKKRKQAGRWQEKLVLDSAGFTAYYGATGQGVAFLPKGEWNKFCACLRKPLCLTFRVSESISSRAQEDLCSQLQNKLSTLCQSSSKETGNAADDQVLWPISWLPDQLCWQSRYSMKELKKITGLKELATFVTENNEAGNISRQELVSMVPVHFLGVQRHHYCLDLCAAPGSKTLQLVDQVGRGSGFVIANDTNRQRLYALLHRIKAMKCSCLLAACHDAQCFPNIYHRVAGAKADVTAGSKNNVRAKQLLFDRILCDVPCSGDGTLRKNPDLWGRWTVSAGIGLHRLQIQIARRGVQLLKLGGLMVYSTCSLNPIENEAVVAQILREAKGEIELLDTSHLLPLLQRRPGMQSWRVAVSTSTNSSNPKDSSLNFQFVEAFDGEDNELKKRGICQSMFAPASEELEWMQLHLACRLYPQDQDTGGFFVALLARKDASQGGAKGTGSVSIEAPSKTFEVSRCREETESSSYTTFSNEAHRGNWENLKETWGLDEAIRPENLYSKGIGGQIKWVRDSLCRHALDTELPNKLDIVNAGLPVFVGVNRPGVSQQYRPLQASISVLAPHIQKRKLSIQMNDFLQILAASEDIPFNEVSNAPQQFLETVSRGCVVFVLDPRIVAAYSNRTDVVAFVAWRSKRGVKPVVGKLEKKSLLEFVKGMKDAGSK